MSTVPGTVPAAMPEDPGTPLVRVVRGGEPPAEELAALTAVLLTHVAARADGGQPEEPASVVPLWEQRGPGTGYRSPVSWRA